MMKIKVASLCAELDTIRTEQESLRKRQTELTTRSMALDVALRKILHDTIDPLLVGHWQARIVLYKDTLHG